MKSLLLSLLFVLMTPLFANSTVWENNTAQDFEKGSLNNTTLFSDGTIRSNARFKSAATQEFGIWSLVADEAGSVYLGTGMRGIIYRWNSGNLEKYCETGELIVTALVFQGENLYAATIPDGKIFQIQKGQATFFAKLPGGYIWNMKLWQNHLLAATGPDGTLYRVDLASKEATVLAKTPEKHLLSMAIDNDGNIYVGSAPSGMVYLLPTGGKITVLGDFSENEIRAMAISGGKLYVGANVAKGFDNVKIVQNIARTLQEQGFKGKPVDRKKIWEEVMSGAVYEYQKNKGWSKVFDLAKNFVTTMAACNGKGVVFATGLEGKVYQLESADLWAVLADLKEDQITALLCKDGLLQGYGTGDSGNLYLREAQSAIEELYYLSAAHDSETFAQWGTIYVSKEGRLALQTRSGNTQKPDEFWSDWSSLTEEPFVKIASPAARYLQYKVTWLDKEAVLKATRLVYRRQNRAPAVKSFKCPLVAGSTHKLLADKPANPVQLSWEIKDPDGDAVRYRLWYQNIQTTYWVEITAGQVYTAANYKWDISHIPDGYYLVKLEASDDLDNPTPAITTELTAPVLIDNNPPVVKIEVSQNTIRGSAGDAFGLVSQVAYRLQGGDWILVEPADGIWDQREELFQFTLPANAQPGITLEVRALDAAGNAGYVFAQIK